MCIVQSIPRWNRTPVDFVLHNNEVISRPPENLSSVERKETWSKLNIWRSKLSIMLLRPPPPPHPPFCARRVSPPPSHRSFCARRASPPSPCAPQTGEVLVDIEEPAAAATGGSSPKEAVLSSAEEPSFSFSMPAPLPAGETPEKVVGAALNGSDRGGSPRRRVRKGEKVRVCMAGEIVCFRGLS